MVAIDVNSDLGESYGVWTLGDDAAMLGIVTSANVACGFHAGDPSVLRAACTLAVHNDVAIGAQVSFPDLPGFGRRHLEMAPDELRDAVLYQLGALDAFAQVAGAEIAYVKPHGALYHATATVRSAAQALVRQRPSTTRRSPCSACPARSCSQPPTMSVSKQCRRPSPTARTPPRAGWSRDANPAAC
jgi:lactam utilization protein B